jgi:hypothetical protein
MVKAMESGGLVEKRISPLRSSQKARAASVEMTVLLGGGTSCDSAIQVRGTKRRWMVVSLGILRCAQNDGKNSKMQMQKAG